MNNPKILCILQLIISSVFCVKNKSGNFSITRACLDEIIKTNIMLKALTVNPDEKADNNWVGIIQEHESTRYDFDFETLIPKEDRIEEITEQLIKGCQDKSAVFNRALIPTGDEPSADRENRESKIQRLLYNVAGFRDNQIKRSDLKLKNIPLSERKKIFTEEFKFGQKGQSNANKEVLNSAVAERITVLYNYINKAVEKKKKIQMCKSDSMKCILLGLQKTLDALPTFCNYSAKCEGDICRLTLNLKGGNTISAEHIDHWDTTEDKFNPINLTKDEAGTSKQIEGETSTSEGEAGTSKQIEDEDD